MWTAKQAEGVWVRHDEALVVRVGVLYAEERDAPVADALGRDAGIVDAGACGAEVVDAVAARASDLSRSVEVFGASGWAGYCVMDPDAESAWECDAVRAEHHGAEHAQGQNACLGSYADGFYFP